MSASRSPISIPEFPEVFPPSPPFPIPPTFSFEFIIGLNSDTKELKGTKKRKLFSHRYSEISWIPVFLWSVWVRSISV